MTEVNGMCVNDDVADWWSSVMSYQSIACHKTVNVLYYSIGILKIVMGTVISFLAYCIQWTVYCVLVLTQFISISFTEQSFFAKHYALLQQ
jgi:hypothetical protein